MATITAGSSKTFTAQVDNSSFVVIAPGGSIGQVVDQNGNIQPIGPNGTRRTFGPLNDLQSITVSMQIGNADVELNGWSGGIPITADTNSTGQTVLDDASRSALTNTGIGPLLPYVGQVASRCSHQNKNNTTNKELMSRSRHNAMVSIKSLALVFWNGFTDFEGTRLETGGGAATYTAAIEYPSGTIAAQVKWGGSTSKSAADLEVFQSDFVNLDIPKGAVFFVRVWRSSSVGIIYNKFGGLLDTEATTTYSGEGFTFGTTTADLTMTPGQFTNIGNTGTGFRPQAIVALTSTPSVALLGDSRVNNDTQLDTVTDGFGLVGELERTFGMQYPSIKLSQSSERCYEAVTRFTYRKQIAAYCSHVISNYGVNDFRDSKTAAQTIAAHRSLAALIGKPYYVCTVAPMANAGNTITDATVNPLRIAYNAIIRKGDEVFAGTLEIADIVETTRDSGLWISGYTSDGLHANTTGSLALQRSGSLRLPF